MYWLPLGFIIAIEVAIFLVRFYFTDILFRFGHDSFSIILAISGALYRLSFWCFVWRATWTFSFPGYKCVLPYFHFFILGGTYWDMFWWYWNVQCCPVRQIPLVVFDYVGHPGFRFSNVMKFKWALFKAGVYRELQHSQGPVYTFSESDLIF